MSLATGEYNDEARATNLACKKCDDVNNKENSWTTDIGADHPDECSGKLAILFQPSSKLLKYQCSIHIRRMAEQCDYNVHCEDENNKAATAAGAAVA